MSFKTSVLIWFSRSLWSRILSHTISKPTINHQLEVMKMVISGRDMTQQKLFWQG